MRTLVLATIAILAANMPLAFANQNVSTLAEYEVPGDANGERFPLLDIQDFKLERQDAHLVMEYKLPVVLTGEENKITMKGFIGANNRAVMIGDKVDAICDMGLEKCDVAYHDLHLNSQKATNILRQMNLSNRDFNLINTARQNFEADPHGLIHF